MKIREPDRTEERIKQSKWYGNEEVILDVGKLIRCKDCIYYTDCLCWNVPKNESPRPKEETFFCADGRRRGCEQE